MVKNSKTSIKENSIFLFHTFYSTGSLEFSEHDIEIFRRYLTFCGIGIQNAQLFEMSVQEYRRNQILLNLARSIFEEQNNLECLVTKIMTEARELLKCERCAVFLVDLDCCEAVSSQLKILMKRIKAGWIKNYCTAIFIVAALGFVEEFCIFGTIQIHFLLNGICI